MRIVVAPDSYKGSITALEVANAIEKGVLRVFSNAQIQKVPIADGGEGTVAALVMATEGTTVRQSVSGPLGEMVCAEWGILGDGETAVIEMAAASGVTLLSKEQLNPLITSTFGTGQLIKAALDKGLRRIIVGIGGSATNDGGTGMAKALGVRFFDKAGVELADGGLALRDLDRIDCRLLDTRLKDTEILIACDVDNPLCGPQGASVVYGPQKGASQQMVELLDGALENYARVATAFTGRNIAKLPGSGAAGGLGAGFLFFTDAILRPGVEIVLENTRFSEKVRSADFIITGEGSTDFQTAFGKAPVGVAKEAQKYGVPVVCLSGNLGKDYENVLDQGIHGLMSIAPGPISTQDSMLRADKLVEEAAARLCRLIKIGLTLGGRPIV